MRQMMLVVTLFIHPSIHPSITQLTHVAEKSITTNFPSADAFIKISSTSDSVVGSNTSPPRNDSAAPRLLEDTLVVEKAEADFPAAAAVEVSVHAKRLSIQDTFVVSGRILFADATLKRDAKVMMGKESFMVYVVIDEMNKVC
jgi:hypothetical protein